MLWHGPWIGVLAASQVQPALQALQARCSFPWVLPSTQESSNHTQTPSNGAYSDLVALLSGFLPSFSRPTACEAVPTQRTRRNLRRSEAFSFPPHADEKHATARRLRNPSPSESIASST